MDASQHMEYGARIEGDGNLASRDDLASPRGSEKRRDCQNKGRSAMHATGDGVSDSVASSAPVTSRPTSSRPTSSRPTLPRTTPSPQGDNLVDSSDEVLDQTLPLERHAYHFVGFVQGRGFRYSCYSCATKTGVTGWVMNNRDGSVNAEVQGTSSQLKSFITLLTRLVRGFGTSWRIAEQSSVETIGGERSFTVVR